MKYRTYDHGWMSDAVLDREIEKHRQAIVALSEGAAAGKRQALEKLLAERADRRLRKDPVALRQEISKAHPDHGGDPERFEKLKKWLDEARQ